MLPYAEIAQNGKISTAYCSANTLSRHRLLRRMAVDISDDSSTDHRDRCGVEWALGVCHPGRCAVDWLLIRREEQKVHQRTDWSAGEHPY